MSLMPPEELVCSVGAGAHAVGLAEAEVGGEEEARRRRVEGDVGVEGLRPVAVLHVDLVPLQHAVTVRVRVGLG